MVKARLGLLMLLGAARLSIASAGTSHPLRMCMCNAADTTLTQTSSFQAPPSSSSAWPRCRKRPRSRREPPLPASRMSLSLRRRARLSSLSAQTRCPAHGITCSRAARPDGQEQSTTKTVPEVAERGLLFASMSSPPPPPSPATPTIRNPGARTLPSRLPAPHLISDPPLFGRPVDV